jgi:hypothetical protein
VRLMMWGSRDLYRAQRPIRVYKQIYIKYKLTEIKAKLSVSSTDAGFRDGKHSLKSETLCLNLYLLKRI